LVDVLAAHHLSPEALTSWVAAAVQRPRRARTGVDLDGLATVAELARGLLDVGRLRAIAV
jgi:predicted glycosyltransferase